MGRRWVPATVGADAYNLASAINSANITGVTATALATNVAAGTYTGAALTGTITINGVQTGSITTSGTSQATTSPLSPRRSTRSPPRRA